MKRRTFLQASATGAALVGSETIAQAAQDSTASKQYYEIRTYRLAADKKQPLVRSYLRDALLPACRRLGIGPVGVFTEIGDALGPSMHALITYSSIQQFADARLAVENDREYQSAAADYLAAAKDEPAFVRIESSLMVAFDAMPKLELPGRQSRVLELRIYESHSESKARRKVDMFNEGEIPIFRNVGLQPVFFGETLIGPQVPNLKYMLATPDLESNKQGWKKFLVDPDWKTMSGNPRYADTVSKVSNLYLTPTDFSEI